MDRCRILDLGCGDGRLLCAIAASLPDSTCTGVDRSAMHLQLARDHAHALELPNTRFVHADLLHLPELGAFDVVLCHGVLSWVPPEVRAATLQAIGRSLSPDGIAWASHLTPAADIEDAPMREAARHAAGEDLDLDRVRGSLLALADQGRADAARISATLARGDGYLVHGVLAPHIEGLSPFDLTTDRLRYGGDARFPWSGPPTGRFATSLLTRAQPIALAQITLSHLRAPEVAGRGATTGRLPRARGPALHVDDVWTLGMVELAAETALAANTMAAAVARHLDATVSNEQLPTLQQHLEHAARVLLQEGVLHLEHPARADAGYHPWGPAHHALTTDQRPYGPDLQVHDLDPIDRAMLLRADGTRGSLAVDLDPVEVDERISRLQRRGLLVAAP